MKGAGWLDKTYIFTLVAFVCIIQSTSTVLVQGETVAVATHMVVR